MRGEVGCCVLFVRDFLEESRDEGVVFSELLENLIIVARKVDENRESVLRYRLYPIGYC